MAQAATEAGPPQAPQRAGLGRRVAGALTRRREASILVVLIGLVVYFSVRTEAFFGTDNAQVVAEFSAPIAIIAAGEVMLLICGEIDLSAGLVAPADTNTGLLFVTKTNVKPYLTTKTRYEGSSSQHKYPVS